jgi:hypothetical protein
MSRIVHSTQSVIAELEPLSVSTLIRFQPPVEESKKQVQILLSVVTRPELNDDILAIFHHLSSPTLLSYQFLAKKYSVLMCLYITKILSVFISTL